MKKMTVIDLMDLDLEKAWKQACKDEPRLEQGPEYKAIFHIGFLDGFKAGAARAIDFAKEQIAS